MIGAQRLCEKVAQTERSIDFSLQISPAFIFAEFPNEIFTGYFFFEIDGSYCGRFSTRGGTMDEQSCDLTPGLHSVSFTGLSVYNGAGQKVVGGISCSGQARIPAVADKMGLIFCFRRPIVKCIVRVVDDAFQAFNISNCLF